MRKTLSICATVLVALALASCGSDESSDDSSTERDRTDVPERGSLEAIVDALDCEESDDGGGHHGDQLYWCQYEDRDDNEAIYLYVFDSGSDAEEQATMLAHNMAVDRADEEDPRGVGCHENWVIDTYSQAAMEVAEKQGALVLVEATI